MILSIIYDLFLVFFVAFRHKSEFAATLLPSKIYLNTGIVEDWWQGGSKIKILFFL